MKEPKFDPRPGQIDYTTIRYAPVVNTVVTCEGKILLVKRGEGMRLYPNCWNGISGFLDDARSIEEKVQQELQEELGIIAIDITSIERGDVFLQEAPEYHKTWFVVPALVRVKRMDFRLNWEAAEAEWFEPEKARSLQLLPGYDRVLSQFLAKYPNVLE